MSKLMAIIMLVFVNYAHFSKKYRNYAETGADKNVGKKYIYFRR